MTATHDVTSKARQIGKCRKCRKVRSRVVLCAPDGWPIANEDGTSLDAGGPVMCCGRVVVMRKVKGHHDPRIPCTAKCLTGKTAECSCSCGGLNHGKAFAH